MTHIRLKSQGRSRINVMIIKVIYNLRILLIFFGILCFEYTQASNSIEKCTNVKKTLIQSANLVRIPKFPRYTEGLVFLEGNLIESFGMAGHSGLQITSLKNQEIKAFVALSNNIFSEGIAYLNHKLYQLTYKSGFAFVYDYDSVDYTVKLNPSSENQKYDGEGWGLTEENNLLIMSNGSPLIRFIDPNNFKKSVKEFVVKCGDYEVDSINELEFIDGQIWANIFKTPYIVLISPANGEIQEILDLGPIVSEVYGQEVSKLKNPICSKMKCSSSDFVLNGIAYDSINKNIYFTGKNWPFYIVLPKHNLEMSRL